MASPIDVMLKRSVSVLEGGMSTAQAKQTERRGSRRCKITQLMRVRPSDPERDHFDDIRGTISMSRSGVYFQSSETGYEIGMRLFVTMPYSKEPTAMHREYLAEVVRRDELPNGLKGIGFKILMEMGFQGGYSFEGRSQRK
jgi:PilZ domain